MAALIGAKCDDTYFYDGQMRHCTDHKKLHGEVICSIFFSG